MSQILPGQDGRPAKRGKANTADSRSSAEIGSIISPVWRGRLARLEYDEEMSVPPSDPSVPAKTSALNIPAGALAGSRYFWARFARLGPLCGSQ